MTHLGVLIDDKIEIFSTEEFTKLFKGNVYRNKIKFGNDISFPLNLAKPYNNSTMVFITFKHVDNYIVESDSGINMFENVKIIPAKTGAYVYCTSRQIADTMDYELRIKSDTCAIEISTGNKYKK